MNRWIKALLFAGSALAFAGATLSQTLVREAPRDVKAGRLVITLPPVATLDGQPDRLSPGARIRDTQNMMVLSGNLVGQNVPVLYRRDGAGLLHELWLLNEDEWRSLGINATNINVGNREAVQKFNEALAKVFSARH